MLSSIFRTGFMALAIISLIASLALAVEPSSTARGASSQSIYEKPYITGSGNGVAVGGYIDMEFEWPENGTSTFDQHRFIPFITGHISDRVTVSAEIEFEHGGNPEKDGEVKLEYAALDFAMSRGFNFRGGVILSPLGSFNLLHDSPLNDLTARPVVSRQLMPSTLSESGMGVFGTYDVGEEGELDYQVYLVNGFNEGVIKDDTSLRVRGGRGSQKADNNDNKAFTGRMGYSPRLGTTLGASVHTGAYDADGDHNLTIAAMDARTTFGPLELQGELATVSADVDLTATPGVAESQLGGYAQANYHILHDTLMQGSVVTLVARGDWVDYDTDMDGDSHTGLTLGANFRPTEETVFKLDYNWAWTTPVGGEKGDAEGRFFFSFASYF